jgi:hypothetical protein
VRYPTLHDAVVEARQSLDLGQDDSTHDARIAAFLPNVLTTRDGSLEWEGPQMAIISWEKPAD